MNVKFTVTQRPGCPALYEVFEAGNKNPVVQFYGLSRDGRPAAVRAAEWLNRKGRKKGRKS